MMLHCPPIDTSDKVFSITPSAMSTGVVTSLTGFTLGGDLLGVLNGTGYGTTAKVLGLNGGYLGGGSFTEALFETKARGRDVVVTTWSRQGLLLLRCDRVTGRAIYISWSGSSNGQIYIGYAKDVPATFTGIIDNYDTIGSLEYFRTTNIASYVTGWNSAATAGDEYEFSLIGNVLTVKWNSQTIVEIDDFWVHMKPGNVLYAASIAEGAIRDTEITFKANAATYTDGDNLVFDPRDWGWKSLQTTGSMSAASTTLTVASATGFAIGDPIIVAVGGEAGAGARNTVGVGGTWPRDRVANVAALPDATTYRAANGAVDAFIWVEDVESVYINYLLADVPTWGEWTDFVVNDFGRKRAFYHTAFLMPRALSAIITNISGNTFTLDTASDVATTNAQVWYDCSPIVRDVLSGSKYEYAAPNVVTEDSWTVQFPTGVSCLPGRLSFPWGEYWTYKGAGRAATELYAPRGTAVASYTFYGEYMIVADFKVRSHLGFEGWNYEEETGYPSLVGYHAIQTGGTYKSGGLFERLDIENTWGGVNLTTRFSATCRDCTGTYNEGGPQQYASWFFVAAYCDPDTWFEDVTFTADELYTAFELFQQDGGGMRRITSTQGFVSSNSSGGGFLFEDVTISLDWNVVPASGWLGVDSVNPGINVNTNIGGGAETPEIIAQGGTIRNPTITITKAAADGLSFDAINVNSGAVNINIEGTHTAKPGEGVITMSDYAPGDVFSGVAIRVDTAGCSITGIRVIGEESGSFGNIAAYSGGLDCVIEDCVAESIFIGPTEQIGTNGNITNAAYDALP